MTIRIRDNPPSVYITALAVEALIMIIFCYIFFIMPKDQRPVDTDAFSYQKTTAYLASYVQYTAKKEGNHEYIACEGTVNYSFRDDYVQNIPIKGLTFAERAGMNIDIYYNPKNPEMVMMPKAFHKKLIVMIAFLAVGILDGLMIVITVIRLIHKLHRIKHPKILEETDVNERILSSFSGFYTGYEDNPSTEDEPPQPPSM